MKKYITLEPREIRFKNEKGDDMPGEDGLMTWKRFFHKIEDHPKWATTYKLTRYMTEIWESFWAATKERCDWVMELGEEAYKELEAACQTPKYQVIHQIHGPQEISGWAIHARLNCQMIVFPKAVINAVDEDPRKKEEIDPEKERALLNEEKKSKKEKAA